MKSIGSILGFRVKAPPEFTPHQTGKELFDNVKKKRKMSGNLQAKPGTTDEKLIKLITELANPTGLRNRNQHQSNVNLT